LTQDILDGKILPVPLPMVSSSTFSLAGFLRDARTRLAFSCPSLWGKVWGLDACGATPPYSLPPPFVLLTRLFSKPRLKRKDFQEMALLAWAQEVPGSNPGAPTKIS
jgi:hypothetical protein